MIQSSKAQGRKRQNTKPRAKAVRILTRVLSDYQVLDEALVEETASLSPEDIGWLQEICSGTLRWKGILDEVINSIAVKKKPSGWLRKVILTAAYQIIAQDRAPIPQVVNETVSMIQEKEGQAPGRFANALLRKIASQVSSTSGDSPRLGENPFLQKNTLQKSFPIWLWKKLVSDYGEEWAYAYARESLDRPLTWIRKKDTSTSKMPSEEFKEGEPGPISQSWRLTQGGKITDLPGFREGNLLVQDISSQKLIQEVSEIVQKELGRPLSLKALDLCAAPGGKTVGLAWNGFQVTATDKNLKRVPTLRDTLSRVRLLDSQNATIQDWKELGIDSAKSGANQSGPQAWDFDLIWVDAPCSGTGILRRHPEIRWLRKEEELAALQKTQIKLAQTAWNRLKSGGYLVYSVCSVLKDEGPRVIDQAILDGGKVGTGKSWFLYPHEAFQGDGFWAILLKKP